MQAPHEMQFVKKFSLRGTATLRGVGGMCFADRRRCAVGMMYAGGEVMGKAKPVRLEDCLRCIEVRGMRTSASGDS